eukprot:15446713-Alexandrium_andersonii.AAC.1
MSKNFPDSMAENAEDSDEDPGSSESEGSSAGYAADNSPAGDDSQLAGDSQPSQPQASDSVRMMNVELLRESDASGSGSKFDIDCLPDEVKKALKAKNVKVPKHKLVKDMTLAEREAFDRRLDRMLKQCGVKTIYKPDDAVAAVAALAKAR